ncbi:MAG: dTDP-glucose 4,6-dehydratase [Bacillota bacterium]|uniref:NAD-dependent epimerase/dehydratase family protein n=1 Tax=Virgibacillus salarius TaxID=447199 RepID=A0A941IC98_9BACI|nr:MULTISPECIES: NAD-dependent epimerase/dehydratase family protein [Bacillaceae]NAZ09886.1 NAD-dependent epimerase/dehydratase family protein [Agaribacter marinus]MBR7797177.1 NAD-dependent epimerase/dehydratase family protein [Virgibacillus salarius]MCC2251286.1 NAD-dependent epimerase/dehydratase family protein [Virgibacillus sp. AGTR]QRZ19476.1 NAD-dependent epimerase/dehydratase family protein [Virgibacillus sp. AGTR]WBX80849.1 NAD-dependent epimerase/dehydratase family protein [Virgibaci
MKRQSLKNSTILVIGGAGFIGSHLIDKLIEEKAKEIIILDNLFTGNKENLTSALEKNNTTLYIDNAENQETLNYIMEEHDIDIVFNCATKALNYSFMNPANAFLTNVIVLKNLLELQRKKKFKTLCHFSSSEAFGSSQYQPMDENHPLAPTTTYAAGKAAADLMLQSYVTMFDLDAFIVRPFNNYGPRQNFTGPLAGVIPTTIRKILSNEIPEIHGSGQQTRDYIYVKDTVDIVTTLYSVIPPGDSVNITTDQQLSIEYIMETIIDEMNYQGEILRKPNRKADVTSHRGSMKKLQSLIGSYSKTDFKDGIALTINWVKQQVTETN